MPTKAGPYSARAPKNPLADNQLMEDSGPLDGGGYDAGDRWCGGERRASPRPTAQDNEREKQ